MANSSCLWRNVSFRGDNDWLLRSWGRRNECERWRDISTSCQRDFSFIRWGNSVVYLALSPGSLFIFNMYNIGKNNNNSLDLPMMNEVLFRLWLLHCWSSGKRHSQFGKLKQILTNTFKSCSIFQTDQIYKFGTDKQQRRTIVLNITSSIWADSSLLENFIGNLFVF